MTSDLDVSADLGGQFLKREDVDQRGRSFTIQQVSRETFEARDGRPAQTRVVLALEGERKFSLNKTNLKALAQAWGKKTAAWHGRTLVVYLDAHVQNRGQVVGGLRVRIAQLAPVAAVASQPDTSARALQDRINALEAKLAAAGKVQAAPAAAVDDDIAFAFGANVGDGVK